MHQTIGEWYIGRHLAMAGVAEFLQSTELFRTASPEAIEVLSAGVRVIELRDGQLLVSKDQQDSNLYILISGLLRVTGRNHRNEPRLLLEVTPGETAAEMSFLADEPAPAGIHSAGNSRVLVLPRPAFETFASTHPQAALTVMQVLSSRLQRFRLAIALHLSDLFDRFGSDALKDLESELELFTLNGGEVLFHEGNEGDALYLMLQGRLAVSVRSANLDEALVATLGPGEIVGEMAMVTGEPRAATVTAIRDTQLARLTKSGFEQFQRKHPIVASQIINNTLAERLREANTGVRRNATITNIAVVPAHPGAPVQGVCDALIPALAKFGRAAHVSSALADHHFGKEGMAQTHERGGMNLRLVEWLCNQEATHDFVLYQGDDGLSAWTERCVRQADHVLIVGSAGADPAPGPIEQKLLVSQEARNRKNAWLVLVHGEENPSGTGQWLKTRNVSHFHVRLNDSKTLDRLVRYLTHRAIALTLGGGFARGLAHIGVFSAFSGLGIDIDAVGGASMGAMIGALWAMGRPGGEIVREISEGCARSFDDLTFPFVAFKSGRRFSEFVRCLFGETQIEDLWIPYFCISANLNRSELRVHSKGSLAKAILATTRAPGVFPPVVYDGELHIDGGVINNVPVDIMKAFSNEGITVGVDVSPPHELHNVRDYGDAISGWPALWKRLISKERIYTPSILIVMIRALEYTGISYKSVRLKHADIYMCPDLLKFKRTDFHLADGIVSTGYECARSNLIQWLARRETAELRPDLSQIMAAVESGSARPTGGVASNAG